MGSKEEICGKVSQKGFRVKGDVLKDEFGLPALPEAALGGGGVFIHFIKPIVSIVVPFFGLTNSILRILKGNPKKELQWRL